MTKNPRRKSDAARRANQVIRGRTMLIMLVLGVATFTVLFLKLYNLQITQHDRFKALATEQQTDSMVISASRGTIYDKNGEIMAISYDVETVILDPGGVQDFVESQEQDIADAAEKAAENGETYTPPEVLDQAYIARGCGGGDYPGAPGEHRQPLLGGQEEGGPGRGRRGPPVHQR